MAILSEEARRKRIEEALKAQTGDGERIPLPWQNAARVFPVIRISLDAFVLNPRSHRIRSQLESHGMRQLVEDSPFGEEAQEVIASILREGEGFEVLKTNLQEEGQRDAGVATDAGLLVNANSRAVALRDIGEKYIRVAILPSDATQQEIDELELRLQMKKELRQEYTYTNELLFVDELCTKYNLSPEQIALELRWAASKSPKELARGTKQVDQAIRQLSIIREVQAISGNALPLTAFDGTKQSLIEVDQRYQDLVKSDPERARRLRDSRLVGILLDLGYTKLRHVDENFLRDYFIPAMEERDLLKDHVRALTSPVPRDGDEVPGIDILEAQGAGQEDEPDVTPMLELLARSANQSTVEVPGEDAPVIMPRESLVDALKTAMEGAWEEANTDQKMEDRLNAPIAFLKDAELRLRKALEAYRKVAEDDDFDAGDFKYLARKVGRATEALKVEIEKHD